MSYGIYRNCEGYSDPTAGAAIRSILREERRQRREAARRRGSRIQNMPEIRKPDGKGKENVPHDRERILRPSLSAGSAHQQQAVTGPLPSGADHQGHRHHE